MNKPIVASKHKKGPGRPKGVSPTWTEKGAPLEDNLKSAVWGELASSPDAFWIHQLWIEQNSTGGVDNMRAAGLDEAYIEEIRQNHIAEFAQNFGLECSKRLRAGDVTFFSICAKMARRLITGTHPQEAGKAGLLAHVTSVLMDNPNHRFTLTELMDPSLIDWDGNLPSEKTLKRWCQELKIPRRTGAPPKK